VVELGRVLPRVFFLSQNTNFPRPRKGKLPKKRSQKKKKKTLIFARRKGLGGWECRRKEKLGKEANRKKFMADCQVGRLLPGRFIVSASTPYFVIV